MVKQKLKDDEVHFLNGLLSGLDDLPDGAWQAACEELIGQMPEFKGRDPYDVWIAWVMQKGPPK
jgi:hypothetical protein